MKSKRCFSPSCQYSISILHLQRDGNHPHCSLHSIGMPEWGIPAHLTVAKAKSAHLSDKMVEDRAAIRAVFFTDFGIVSFTTTTSVI